MYGYQGTGSRGSGVKEVVLLVVFLFVAASCVGMSLADSYWGNPPRKQAGADQTRIESRDIEERANRALLWQDRWNKLGMVLAAAVVVGLLVIAGTRVAMPVAVQAYGRYVHRRAQLVEQETRLIEKRLEQEVRQTERLREERRLEEVRLQRARVTSNYKRGGGNDRERGFRL
jgi:hypothetical protein